MAKSTNSSKIPRNRMYNPDGGVKRSTQTHKLKTLEDNIVKRGKITKKDLFKLLELSDESE